MNKLIKGRSRISPRGGGMAATEGGHYICGVVLVLMLAFSSNSLAATGKAKEVIRHLESKEQKTITLPKIEKGRLGDGFKYYILPEHELPTARAIVYIRGGVVYDPPGKSGLTAITAELLRNGGTSRMSPDQVDEHLDEIASAIEIGAYKEHLAASVRCRSENFEESLGLLLDMFFRPRFDKGRFDLIKKQFADSVRRRADSPEALATTGFNELLYGRDNPWGAYTTQASIDAVTIDDVKMYHGKYFHPGGMIIGVAGDVRPSKVIGFLESYKYYPEGVSPTLHEPGAGPDPIPGIHIIDKDSNQVIFNVGHGGSYRFNPDKYALIVMNDILGGSSSFKSRLPALVRVEMGLAYSVWSSYSFGPRNAPGSFEVYLATKTDSARQALDIVTAELERFARAADITEDEINRSKDSILRRLIFEYSSAADTVASVVRFNYFGYPDNYVEEYGEKIGRVGLDDVKRVAGKYLHPERLQFVLVGDREEVAKQFGKDIKIDCLTIEE